MLVPFCFLWLISCIFAAVVPKPCCTGGQLSATLHEVIGSYDYLKHIPSTTELTVKLFYDYNAKMIRTEMEDGTIIIEDHNKNKHFEIKGHTCTTRTLTDVEALQPPCVPANASYRGRHTIGDDINYEVDTWYIPGTTFGNVTVAVMPDDCTPVMQGLSRATSEIIQQTTIFFHNVTFGAPTANTFHVPGSCTGI